MVRFGGIMTDYEIQNEEYIKQFNDLTNEINQHVIGSTNYKTLSRKREKLTTEYKNWLNSEVK